MTMRTVRGLADRMVELGMLTREKAVATLAGIANGDAGYLDRKLKSQELVEWLPDLGVAFSVHGEDVDFVEDYYRYMLQHEVAPLTGAAFSDVVLVRDEDDAEVLHFLRDGETVWWHVEHLSDDYVDQGAVADQITDLEPGGDDPRVFHQYRPEKRVGCDDDFHVLATPEQARVLTEEFGIDFEEHGPATDSAQPERFLDAWLSDMDGALAEWRSRFLPADFPLDFSLSSLDALEPLVPDRFTTWASVTEAADDPFLAGAVRYVGETLLRNAPGRWGYDGTPLLRSTTPRAFRTIVVPLHELAHLAVDREPGTLSAAAETLQAAADRYAAALRVLDESRTA